MKIANIVIFMFKQVKLDPFRQPNKYFTFQPNEPLGGLLVASCCIWPAQVGA